ncbi:hypothetical protein M8J76_000535 [Diaphorina citri]|nr:hypothetical protein M8J76_000535 [Diaphorina citri]
MDTERFFKINRENYTVTRANFEESSVSFCEVWNDNNAVQTTTLACLYSIRRERNVRTAYINTEKIQ